MNLKTVPQGDIVNYIGESVAIGMMMINSEGYDEMVVMKGTIEKHNDGFAFTAPGQEPFEMVENWLTRLKPVEESMGKEFQGAKYCLIIGSLSQA